MWAPFKPTLSVSLSGDHVVDDARAAVCVVVKGRVRVVEGRGGVLLLRDVAWQQVREAAIKQTTIRMQEVKEGKAFKVKVWHQSKNVYILQIPVVHFKHFH